MVYFDICKFNQRIGTGGCSSYGRIFSINVSLQHTERNPRGRPSLPSASVRRFRGRSLPAAYPIHQQRTDGSRQVVGHDLLPGQCASSSCRKPSAEVLPPWVNDFIACLKDSSLVSVLAVNELTQLGRLRTAEPSAPWRPTMCASSISP